MPWSITTKRLAFEAGLTQTCRHHSIPARQLVVVRKEIREQLRFPVCTMFVPSSRSLSDLFLTH